MQLHGIVALLLIADPSSARPDDRFPPPVNTQAAGEHPPTPQEMLELVQLPSGFSVDLYAAEPDLRQPVAFDFDDRGRIWVAENYTYSAHAKIDTKMRDRIVILDDTDGDGQHDSRKVFWDKGRMLTSVVCGFGGVWILNDGTLSLIPDRNKDDVPDSAPIKMLDGWTDGAGHNFVNGLTWGPDGWLYGRHGITDTSWPGVPDRPMTERQPMNCGIWRFHPVDRKFEIVCQGTTNPWGLDYNAVGDMFMTNNVIGHLWHVIPGAHYERMFGADFNPYLYELMSQTADHYHWDHTGTWTASRDGNANDLGGGHSHCGALIYHGQNFPRKYVGQIFMCNTHGRRINVNHLEPDGSSYVGKREPDFMTVDTPWFRGVEIRIGPAGCLYVSDWSDNGECHDHDGVHRTSGRLYKISYNDSEDTTPADHLDAYRKPVLSGVPLADAGVHQLLSADSAPEWHRRRIRRRLQEFLMSGTVNVDEISHVLMSRLVQSDDEATALNDFWLIAAANAITPESARQLLNSRFPHIRAQIVRHICESQALRNELAPDLLQCASNDPSPVVAIGFASAIQKLPVSSTGKSSLATRLLRSLTVTSPCSQHLSHDRNLRLMLWYAWVTHKGNDYPYGSPSPKLDFMATRYLTETATSAELARLIERVPALAEQLDHHARKPSDEVSDGILGHLAAIRAALRGRGKVRPPDGWAALTAAMKPHKHAGIDRLINELGTIFGDGASLAELHRIVLDRKEDHVIRRNAIHSLETAAAEKSVPVLLSLLNDKAVYEAAAGAMAAFDDKRIPETLLRKWNGLRHGSREAAINTMCSRRSYAVALVRAVDAGRVNASDLTATHVRQLLSFEDDDIEEVISEKWGIIGQTSESRKEKIESLRKKLTSLVLAEADLSKGAELFKKRCSSCHRLYGQGQLVGPDLTGGNRANLEYLLSNVVAPSDEVPRQYTTTVIATKSGRVIDGVVISETPLTVTMRTADREVQIPVSDIDERRRTNKSLMPDGLLDTLSDDQVRDLMGFLQKRR